MLKTISYYLVFNLLVNFHQLLPKSCKNISKIATFVEKIHNNDFRTFHAIKVTDEGIILTLYQLMKDIHELFTKYNIPYWADGGTLLGAVRNQGIIPWDDDLDISIDQQYEKNIIALKPILEQLGYGLYKIAFGFKIFPLDGITIDHVPYKAPCLDIFLTEEDDNKIFYKKSLNMIWGYRDNLPIFITKEELYPLKEYNFGLLTIFGANNPTLFLNNLYGCDWNILGKKWANHIKEQYFSNITANLNYIDFQPAQPLGPLLDRII